MKSRYSQFATAAAVLVLAAVSLVVFDKSTAPAYAITELPRQFEQARTIHVQGWHHFRRHTMPDGSRIPPVAIDNWIDVENVRSRQIGTGLSVNAKDVKVTVSEVISDGPVQMILRHTEKTVMYLRMSEYQQRLTARRISKLLSGQLFGDLTRLSDSTIVGAEQIEGVTYDIWQSNTRDGIRWMLWVSADTGRLGRAQIWSEVTPGRWEIGEDYQRIEYNVEIPESVFTKDPPSGYAAMNSPQTAALVPLGTGGGGYADEHYSLECNTKLAFALPDGSVIFGWQSFDRNSEQTQETLFEGLAFGGPLPKLPVEIYALKPADGDGSVVYTGYHLASTRQGGQFIEWSLYVPNGVPPTNVQTAGYRVLYRWNLEFEPRWNIGITVTPEFPIETAEDFDTWVLGAMAEFSDDTAVPQGLTYQKVLDLARQVRTSVGP
jgi:hypothetical protein